VRKYVRGITPQKKAQVTITVVIGFCVFKVHFQPVNVDDED